jgi:hypothetical protein
VAGFGNISGAAQNFATTFADTSKSTTDKIAAGLQLAAGIAGEIGNILGQNSERNLKKIEEEKNAEIMALEERKNAGIISEAQFNAAKEKIDNAARKKELQEKRKAFNQNKALQIAQAVISTAQSVLAAWTLVPANPIVSGIFSGIAAAVGAAQIALISSQKFPEGGSGGSGGSGSISAPSIPNTGAVGGATEVSNQPNLVQRGLEAQKVYILESEITDSQNRVDVIETRARF